MKRIFTILATVAMVVTSCTTGNTEQVAVGELETVTFKLTGPQMVSRTIGDGQLADNLIYGIYDADSEYLNITGTATFDDQLEATVSLQLVAGKTYYILCWATATGNPYTLSLAEKSVTADYTDVLANDETLDAFYAWQKIDVVKNMPPQTVTLYRPFAQLNYGATEQDVANAQTAGVVPTHSSITVTAYTKFNLETGVVDAASKQEITFKTNTLPTEKLTTNAGDEYVRMGTVYLLWSAEQAASAEACTLNMFETKGGATTLINNPITEYNVNFRRNWRTHIVGTLLTDDVTLEFIIEPDFPDEIIH